VEISSLSDPAVLERLDSGTHEALLEELSMLDIAGEAFDTQQVLEGKLTPVFFGSARNNFGVQLLMDGFLDHAGPPRPRMAGGRIVPMERIFLGFIFKIRQTWIPATATASFLASARERSRGT
jgi:peptide chain release factor 3